MSSRYQAGIVLPGYNALKVANAPTIGTATAGVSNCASVAFTAPACVGGGAISGYTVFSDCGAKLTSGASSPLVVTGLTTSSSYTFKAIATNVYGPSYPSAASNSITAISGSSQSYTTPGTYSWVAPAGVTSVSVVAVGGGETGCNYGGGGGGGALGYVNNYSVTPTSSYTVVVGSGGRNPCATPGDSYFVSTAVVKGGAAVNNSCTPASYTGTGGGAGGVRGRNNVCYAGYAGGGGAGGYSGAGGHGITYNCCGYGVQRTAGAGGGGGGGGGTSGYGGGGVGLFGQGANGSIAAAAGGGGSGGADGGATYVNPGVGLYGGGSGGGAGGSQKGGYGAVRIVWPGNIRLFPSTLVGAP